MRFLISAALLITLLMTAVAFAVPAGRTLEFTKSALGTVIFDGKLHNSKVQSCAECHNKDTFPKMKKGTVSITMDQIYQGKLCGTCHNGQKAFDAKASCARCHIRK